MTELDLYKFLNTNRPEIHIYLNGMEVKDMSNYGIEPDVIEGEMQSKIPDVWEVRTIINPLNLTEFTKMLGYSYFDDGGIDAKLLYDGSVGLDLMPVMDSFDINPANIFHKDNHFVKR